MSKVQQSIMADFVFGGIEADEARLLATERVARSAIRHFHQIQPIDPLPETPVTLTVQVGPDVAIDRVTAYVTTDGSNPAGAQGCAENGFAVSLKPASIRWEPLIWDYVTLWQGELPPQPEGTLVQYRIEGWRSFGPPLSLWSREMNLDRTVERPALYGYHVDRLAPPAWAREAVLYQIFVDRFTGVTNRWLEPEELTSFQGGTLRGVIDHLDYMVDLGVTAIWLSPIFVTESYHGYDTTDFYHVDPRFGSDADLVELFEQAHARGLRVILDFVANHTSVKFAPFVEALNNPDSDYRRWFNFDGAYKHGYRAFFDVATMPQMDTDYPPVRDFLVDAAQHWLRAGADGLRLDYAAGPSHAFWSAFRAACRAVKPDCWLFGEVTRAGDPLRSYTGRLDGCLDFAFCRAVRMLCAFETPAITLSQFANQLTNSRAFFGSDFLLPAFLDNHDMNRFLWVAGDDKRRLQLALGLLFTMAGPPVLYYGTEVGLSQPREKGSWREESRHPMLWGDAQDRALLAYTQRLITLRKEHPALSAGTIVTQYLDEELGIWVVERQAGGDRLLIAVNVSGAARTAPLPAAGAATLEGEILSDALYLDPYSVTVLIPGGQ